MRENYDIIHCQYGTIGKSFIYLKEIMDTKIFTSFRGYDLTRFVKENGPSVYEELFKRGDAFLPVCDYFARRLRTRLPPGTHPHPLFGNRYDKIRVPRSANRR